MLLILHLSDIHFEKRGDVSKENLDAIIKILKTMEKFEGAIIVISGDVAYSGKIGQYNIAYNFFNMLKQKIKQEFDIGEIHFVIAPGNHDVDYDKGSITHQQLCKIYEDAQQDAILGNEIKKMNAFYNHANGLFCFQDKQSLVSTKVLSVADTTIRFNLINTGAYSSLEEDQGLHYLPPQDLMKLENDEESDYIFTVMHHPHHWYHESMKKELERKIYEKSDLIFVGHEHYSSSMDVGVNNSRVKIYAGGELANKGDWSDSEFYIGMLGTQTREYAVTRCKWDSKRKIYIKIRVSKDTF